MSAIDLIHDGTRLLIGHAKGLVSTCTCISTLSPSLPPLSLFILLSLSPPRSPLSLPLFSSPQITHWDLESNKTLRFIEDAHPPGYAVLSIKVRMVYLLLWLW